MLRGEPPARVGSKRSGCWRRLLKASLGRAPYPPKGVARGIPLPCWRLPAHNAPRLLAADSANHWVRILFVVNVEGLPPVCDPFAIEEDSQRSRRRACCKPVLLLSEFLCPGYKALEGKNNDNSRTCGGQTWLGYTAGAEVRAHCLSLHVTLAFCFFSPSKTHVTEK